MRVPEPSRPAPAPSGPSRDESREFRSAAHEYLAEEIFKRVRDAEFRQGGRRAEPVRP